MKIEILDKLYDDIKVYCQSNDIEDIDKFINKILNQGFTTEKWGIIAQTKSIVPEVKQMELLPPPVVINKIINSNKENTDLYGESKIREV